MKTQPQEAMDNDTWNVYSTMPKKGKLVGVCNGECHCDLPTARCFTDHDEECKHCQKSDQPEKEDWEKKIQYIMRMNANGIQFSNSEFPDQPTNSILIDFIHKLLAKQKEAIKKI